MNKIDFKKELKHLYNPSPKAAVVVDVPPLNFLMIDGRGDPNTAAAYREAVEALFSLSYALKFMVKKDLGVDYAVMPLERAVVGRRYESIQPERQKRLAVDGHDHAARIYFG